MLDIHHYSKEKFSSPMRIVAAACLIELGVLFTFVVFGILSSIFLPGDIKNNHSYIVPFFGFLILPLIYTIRLIFVTKKHGGPRSYRILRIKVVRLDGKDLRYWDCIKLYSPSLLIFTGSICALAIKSLYVEFPADPIEQSAYILRPTEYFIQFIVFYYIGSILYRANDRYNRAPHDLLAGTAVIKVTPS